MTKTYFRLPYGIRITPPNNGFKLKVLTAPSGWKFFTAGPSIFLIEQEFRIAWYRLERSSDLHGRR